MKIAVPVTKSNQVDDHFGHCEYYTVYAISAENKILETQTIPSVQGCGCKSDIAGVLAQDGVTIMLAGGIGNGAINVLNRSGIEVVRGCSGDATLLVDQFLNGSLTDSGESCQTHNEHHSGDHDHVCNH